MKTSIACVALFVAYCSAAVITWKDKPTFCKEHDCPKFTVISSNDKYELRSYEKSYWVTATMPASDYWQNGVNNRIAFYKLFGYISGENADGTKMAMTAPVLKYHTKDQVMMGFMIPFSIYDKAPQPTDSRVRLFTSPASQAYVKKYTGEGWAQDYVHTAKLQEFRDELAADNVIVTDDTFYVLGYDGPRVRFNQRHHEIWIAKP